MLRAVTVDADATIQILPQATLKLLIECLRKRPRRSLLARAGYVAVMFALSAAPALAGCNSGDVANPDLLSGANCRAAAAGVNATAVGDLAKAAFSAAAAFGALTEARGLSTAVGTFARALGIRATAVGSDAGFASGTAPGFVAIGAAAGAKHSLGAYSTTIGGATDDLSNPRATGDWSVAIGGGDGTVLGGNAFIGAKAEGFASVAMGVSSQASGTAAVALGSFTTASGVVSLAFGDLSVASGSESIAFGRNGTASADFAVAFGSRAKASRKNAVAIGHRSVANVANTVSVGRAGAERRIVNVAPGLLNTDAVNLAQVKALVIAAVAQASATAPAVSAVPAGSQAATRGADDAVRRELAELRAMVRQQQVLLEQQMATIDEQQQRIAKLEGRTAAR